MDKVSVEGFKETLAAEVGQHERVMSRIWDRHERIRERLECGPSGVLALLTTAHVASRFEGFPGRVRWTSNGKDLGVELVRDGQGRWRIDGTHESLHASNRNGFGEQDVREVHARLLLALGISPSDAALARLRQVAGWAGDMPGLAHQVKEIAWSVPAHTLAASLGHLDRLHRLFGLEHPAAGDAVAWIDAMRRLGIDLDAVVQGHPAVFRLAESGAFGEIHDLVRRGARIDMAGADGRTAAFAAAGRMDVALLRNLMALGADHRRVDRDGNTLLHEVAKAPMRHANFDALAPAVEGLMALGLDRGAVNAKGETPADVLRAAAQEADDQDGLRDEELELVDSVIAALGGQPPAIRMG